MVCAPVRSIIPSPKLGDYLSVQAHKPCSISHIEESAVSLSKEKKNKKKQEHCLQMIFNKQRSRDNE